MKQLVILSGKGGTGKTTVAAALAHLASQELAVVLVDADVDAANLELVLDPNKEESQDFISGQVAVIAPERCIQCGRCAEVCRFDAVIAGEEVYRVDSLACEGCASCFYQCPEDAISMEEQHAGRWFRSGTRFGPLFHAHLFAGQENSGKLVTLVKQQGRLRGVDTGAELLLVDGPPGIGCPVISASAGADVALHVVEPTVSGIHDLERIIGTTDHFGVPSLVAINKADLNPARSDEIVAFCAEQGVQVVGRIPYDNIVTEAMVQGQPVTAYTDAPVVEALRGVWLRVKQQLSIESAPGERGWV
ncbi:MAG TPA: 4Fe-4S dicluster domain-containing protein [Chloroflexi bacterium]|nr:4Fe-4S dicluster domain-containing protein [Chloroflexota bacterium]